ncbi:dTMP kinase [Williamsia maris]|uniref:Thymidylate kinase n=1 Tax=Williamsia maris TaxID=72806 RepID=A0ABT1HH68_9NOCA|nr:dTMP kinase [Williamsia maris]
MLTSLCGVGVLIAVEGIDGAGKRTLVDGLTSRWRDAGRRVTTMAFPRYGESVHADIAAEALHGSHGDLRSSAYAMAMLFALDRAGAAADIRAALAGSDVVLLDRYVASNAAYTAARCGEDATGEAVEWVAELEFHRFALPVPDHHLLIDVPAEVAMGRAAARGDADTTRGRDLYERDNTLQHDVDAVYRQLAQNNWLSPWWVLDANLAPSLADDLLTA